MPDVEVTATEATALTTAAMSGQQSVTTAEQALRAADDARQPARTSLLDLMSTLIANLDKKLTKDDPRWLALGLEMPSTQTTPSAPTGLRATVMDSEILLECDAMPLATRYRWRRKVVGVDNSYHLAASTTGPMVVLDGIGEGITLEIIVQAVNGSSQRVASEPVVVATPAAAAAAKPAGADAQSTPNGNGTSKTNGAGGRAVARII